MNGVIGFVLAVLVYPGLVAAAVAALLLGWVRASARGAIAGAGASNPLGLLRETRSMLATDSTQPDTHPAALVIGTYAALVLPLVALALLPVPGNPIVSSIGLGADVLAEGALLLGMPLARLFIGWVTPSAQTRLAADRFSRAVAGAVLPMALALTVTSTQVGSALIGSPRPTGNVLALAARVIAAAAFACALPVLAHSTSLVFAGSALDAPGGELAELSGRDLALMRIGEAVQLVAVCTFFVTAFVVPVFAQVSATVGVAAIWIVGLLMTAAGIGIWDGRRGGRIEGRERAPLTWWVGVPVLLALLALVASTWGHAR
jgi:formate hydrogenlyase subunit 4